MSRARSILRLALAALLLSVAVGGAIRLHAQSAAVSVASAVLADGQLTITGKNFGSAPTVTVGGASVALSDASDTTIVAAVGGLRSGIYVVSVSRDGGATPEGTAQTSVVIP